VRDDFYEEEVSVVDGWAPINPTKPMYSSVGGVFTSAVLHGQMCQGRVTTDYVKRSDGTKVAKRSCGSDLVKVHRNVIPAGTTAELYIFDRSHTFVYDITLFAWSDHILYGGAVRIPWLSPYFPAGSFVWALQQYLMDPRSEPSERHKKLDVKKLREVIRLKMNHLVGARSLDNVGIRSGDNGQKRTMACPGSATLFGAPFEFYMGEAGLVMCKK